MSPVDAEYCLAWRESMNTRALTHATHLVSNVLLRGINFNGDVVRCALMT